MAKRTRAYLKLIAPVAAVLALLIIGLLFGDRLAQWLGPAPGALSAQRTGSVLRTWFPRPVRPGQNVVAGEPITDLSGNRSAAVLRATVEPAPPGPVVEHVFASYGEEQLVFWLLMRPRPDPKPPKLFTLEGVSCPYRQPLPTEPAQIQYEPSQRLARIVLPSKELVAGTPFTLRIRVDEETHRFHGHLATPPPALEGVVREQVRDVQGQQLALTFSEALAPTAAEPQHYFSLNGRTPDAVWLADLSTVRLRFDADHVDKLTIRGLRSADGRPVLPQFGLALPKESVTAEPRKSQLKSVQAVAHEGPGNDVVRLRFSAPVAINEAQDAGRYSVVIKRSGRVVTPARAVWDPQRREVTLHMGHVNLPSREAVIVRAAQMRSAVGTQSGPMQAGTHVVGDHAPPRLQSAIQNTEVDATGCTVDVVFNEALDPSSVAEAESYQGTGALKVIRAEALDDQRVRLVFDLAVWPGRSQVIAQDIVDLAGSKGSTRGGIRTSDGTLPQVISVTALARSGAANDVVRVRFSELVREQDATDPKNYTFEFPLGTKHQLEQYPIRWLPGEAVAEVMLAGPAGEVIDLEYGAPFRLTIRNIHDVAANAMPGPLTVGGLVGGDGTGPRINRTILNTRLSPSGRVVDLVASEIVDPASAQNAQVATTGPGRVTDVTLLGDRRTLRVTLSAAVMEFGSGAWLLFAFGALALVSGLVIVVALPSSQKYMQVLLLVLFVSAGITLVYAGLRDRNQGTRLRLEGLRDLAGNASPLLWSGQFERPDPQPPRVVSGRFEDGAFKIRFSGPMDASQATRLSNYTLDIGRDTDGEPDWEPIDLAGSSLTYDFVTNVVTLRLPRRVSRHKELQPGAHYLLTVSNVTDIYGSQIITGTRVRGRISPPPAPPLVVSCQLATPRLMSTIRRALKAEPADLTLTTAHVAVVRFSEPLEPLQGRRTDTCFLPKGPETRAVALGPDSKTLFAVFDGPLTAGSTALVVRRLKSAQGTQIVPNGSVWVLDPAEKPQPAVISASAISHAGTARDEVRVKFNRPMIAALATAPDSYHMVQIAGGTKTPLPLNRSTFALADDGKSVRVLLPADRPLRSGARIEVSTLGLLDGRRRRLGQAKPVTATVQGDRRAPALVGARLRTDIDPAAHVVDLVFSETIQPPRAAADTLRTEAGTAASRCVRLDPPALRMPEASPLPEWRPPVVDEDALRRRIAALAGPDSRLPGYAGNRQARDFIVTELKRLGYQPVVEPVDVVMPIESTAQLEITEAGEGLAGSVSPLHCLAPNHVRTSSLPEGGLTGTLIEGARGRLRTFTERNLTGSIVLMDFSSGDGFLNAVALGARAVIFVDDGQVTLEEAAAKVLDAPCNIPRFWLSRQAGQRLRQTLKESESIRVRVRAQMQWRRVRTWNIWAELPGLDEPVRSGRETIREGMRWKDRALILAAGYDAASLVPAVAPGAEAAAAPVALLELARTCSQQPLRRSLVFLFSGAHFAGCHGTRAFVTRHLQGPDENGGVWLTADRAAGRRRLVDSFIGVDLNCGSDHIRVSALDGNGSDEDLRMMRGREMAPLLRRWTGRFERRLERHDEHRERVSFGREVAESNKPPRPPTGHFARHCVGTGAVPALAAVTDAPPGPRFATSADTVEGLTKSAISNLRAQIQVLDALVDAAANDPVWETTAITTGGGKPRRGVVLLGDTAAPAGTIVAVTRAHNGAVLAPVEATLTDKDGRFELAPTVGGLEAYVIAPDGRITHSSRAGLHAGDPAAAAPDAATELVLRLAPCRALTLVFATDAALPAMWRGKRQAAESELPFGAWTQAPDTQEIHGPALVYLHQPNKSTPSPESRALLALPDQPSAAPSDLVAPAELLAARRLVALNRRRLAPLKTQWSALPDLIAQHESSRQSLLEAERAWSRRHYVEALSMARVALLHAEQAAAELSNVRRRAQMALTLGALLLLGCGLVVSRLLVPKRRGALAATVSAVVAALGMTALWLLYPPTRTLSVGLAAGAGTLTVTVVLAIELLLRLHGPARPEQYGAATDPVRSGLSAIGGMRLHVALAVAALAVLTAGAMWSATLQTPVVVERQVAVGATQPTRVLLRRQDGGPLGPETWQRVQSALANAGSLVPRGTLVQPGLEVVNVENGRTISIQALLGLTHKEPRASEIEQTLVGDGSRWFRADETDAVVLPEHLATRLGMDRAEVGEACVRLLGRKLRVTGILDCERVDRLTHAGGAPLMPADPQDSKARLACAGVGIVPLDTLLDLGGAIETVAITDIKVADVLSRVSALPAAHPVTAVVEEDGRVTALGPGPADTGTEAELWLLLPSLILVMLSISIGLSVATEAAPASQRAEQGRKMGGLLTVMVLTGVTGVFAGWLLGLLGRLTLHPEWPTPAPHGSLGSSRWQPLLVFAAFLLAAGYPVWRAYSLAAAAFWQRWGVTGPHGPSWQFEWPDPLRGRDMDGLWLWLHEQFTAHVQAADGGLLVEQLQTRCETAGEGAPRYRTTARLWLAPLDFGVSQDMELEAAPSPVHNVYTLSVSLELFSGPEDAWQRAAKRFVRRLHLWILQWHRMPASTKEDYRARAATELTSPTGHTTD